MSLINNTLYKEDVDYLCGLDIPWDRLKNKSMLITGATGMIGSLLVDTILEKNKNGLNCRIAAMGRDRKKAYIRFAYCVNDVFFQFIEHDINQTISEDIGHYDYIFHLASNTHPRAYATDPIGTITTNVFGLYNILEYAKKTNTERVVFASSNEVYGENRGDVEFFDEEYMGYINCNTLRAGYQESKRCGESLCQAYISQEKMEIVIPRLTRSYGPTLLSTDTKALSQFLKNGINNEDIVLKSEGTQYYSYTYSVDAVAGLLYVSLKGKCGETYNISDINSDIMLKDLAKIVADISGTKVVFDLPDDVEAAGFSTVTKARLDNTKIKKLGYKAHYDIKHGIEKTMKILLDLQER